VAISILEVTSSSAIPQFAPFGVLYYAQDTGDLWIGTGFSTGSDYDPSNPGPNVNAELIASGSGGAPGGFNGDIQYNNLGAFGGSAATVDALGNISALSVTATTATISTLVAPAATITTLTATTATITTLTVPTEIVTNLTATTATITNEIATTATVTTDHVTNSTIVTATVTSTLELQTATIVDSLGSTGTVGQALESTGTGVKWAAVSSTETWAALTGAMTYTQVAPWYNVTSTVDSGISRLAAGSLAIGDGTAGDATGILTLEGIHCNLGTTVGLQYDPNSVLGLVLGSATPIKFSSSTPISAGVDTGISRLGAASLAIGNGTVGNSSGILLASIHGFGATATSTTPDTGISRLSAGVIGVGTGAATSTAGSLIMTTATVSSTLYGGVYWSAGNAGVTQAAEAVGTIATTGGIVTTFTAVSDERLKISTSYLGGLEELLGITPIRYRWNAKGQELSGQTGDRDYIGFSAQNVEKSIPEAIQSKKGPEQYLSFDDRPVIAAAVNAIKELAAENKELRKRLDALEAR